MSAVKPILLDTLPIYAMMSLMIVAMTTVYEVIEEVAINYPSYSFSALSLLFFSLMVVCFVPSVMASRLTERHGLKDIRIQLPAHWRYVILDVIAWIRGNAYAQMLLLFGLVGVFWGISGAAVYSLRAIQASTLDYLLVILVGTFVGIFLFSARRVLYRSALAPLDPVSDEGIDSIVRALPAMGPRRIELLKRWGSGTVPPRGMRWMSRFYMLGATGLGVSAVTPVIGLPSLTLPSMGMASIAMMLGIASVFVSALGKRRSTLSEGLSPDGGQRE